MARSSLVSPGTDITCVDVYKRQVYDTRSGNTAHMAEYIIEGMRQVEGVEARAFDLDAVDEQYVRESAALIVGLSLIHI